MIKIFFTGSTGFVGTRLLEGLSLDKDKFFVCPVRKKGGDILIRDNITYIEGDYENDYADYLADCHYVIHLAAELDSKSPLIHKVNIDWTKKILEGCDKNKLKKFIFFSSITTKRKKRVAYSETKKKAEDIIREFKLPYLIVRPGWILGRGSRSVSNFINYLKKFPFFIPIIGTGKTLMQPIYIDDLIFLLKKILFNSEEENKIIEIGGFSAVSYNNFISYFAKKIGLKKIKIYLPVFLCKIIAICTNILSLDAVSDFEYDTEIDNAYLAGKYNFKPRDYKEIINEII